MERLSDNVHKILKDISMNENFVEPQINCYDQLGKGQGFLGDVFFIQITEKKGNKKLDLIVKQATSSEFVKEHFPMPIVFHNEKKFYENVWPAFVKFQRMHLRSAIFDNIATYYATDLEPGKECLILENLRTLNYANLKKSDFYDREHAEFVLKKYGQFHGLSFAYKSKNPDEFQSLSQLYIPYWAILSKIELFERGMEKLVKRCLAYFDPTQDKKIVEKLKHFAENFAIIFQQSCTYNGEHGVILQGDCWSNNVLFKYKNSGKIDDIKLIDFQISNLGTVVNDLSYSLYAGGTQEMLNDFDSYLKIYHDSVSDTCAKFGCTNFISFDELKKEWKQYSKFGFLLGLSLIESKLSEDKSQEEMKNQLNETETSENVEIKKKQLELIYHMYENDFL